MAYLHPRPAPWLGPLAAPVPVPQARRISPCVMGEPRYDLVSVVQHIGSLGGGHYVAHARNRLHPARRFFTFDDSTVSPVAASDGGGGAGGGAGGGVSGAAAERSGAAEDARALARKEGYLLFYQRVRPASGPLAPAVLPARETSASFLRGAAAGAAEGAAGGGGLGGLAGGGGGASAAAAASAAAVAAAGASFFVSRSWWQRYRTLACPGPITNADILCDHGAVRRDLRDRLGQLAVSLSSRQYEVLAQTYGAAEPPLCEVALCRECQAEAKALFERRKREREKILRVDTTTINVVEGHAWFLMSEVWLARWRSFINDEGPTDGTGRGVLPPGPVDNARLLGKNGRPLPNLRSIVHYRGVNENVFRFLSGIYGGGPQLKRSQIDIYAPARE